MKKINGSFCSVHSADKLLDVSESRMVTAYGIRSNVCSAVGALDFSPIASVLFEHNGQTVICAC